jgi:hypothetical protein
MFLVFLSMFHRATTVQSELKATMVCNTAGHLKRTAKLLDFNATGVCRNGNGSVRWQALNIELFRNGDMQLRRGGRLTNVRVITTSLNRSTSARDLPLFIELTGAER